MERKNNRKRLQYLEARERIVDLILDKGLQVGDLLPTLDSLSETLGIGRISVQRAVRMLAEEGILENIRGSGCFLMRIPERGEVSENGDERPGFVVDELLTGAFTSSGVRTLRFGVTKPDLNHFPSLWRETVRKFQRHYPTVTVEMVPLLGYDDLHEKLDSSDLDVIQIPGNMLESCVKNKQIAAPSAISKFSLGEKSFYPAFKAAAEYDGVTWGTPLIVSVLLMYGGSGFRGIHGNISPSDGFWDFLAKAANLADSSIVDGPIITNDHSLLELFFHTTEWDDRNEIGIFTSPRFAEFLDRVERYYRNDNLFHHTSHMSSIHAPVALFDGGSPVVFGNSCWIPSLVAGGCAFETLRIPTEGNSKLKASTLLNVVSNNTMLPFEAVDFLNYLADFETQKRFAVAGRPVARKDANEYLNIPMLNDESLRGLRSSFDNCRVHRGMERDTDNAARLAIKEESKRWHEGASGKEEFLRRVAVRFEFMKRGLLMQKENTMKRRMLCDAS
jgi:DNA-binding transcriptional regulator YhcF (GntR family)